MTDWPDLKVDPRGPVLTRLCAADDLKEPLATMKRNLVPDEMTSEELDAALVWLQEQGVIGTDSQWVYLSRSAIKAALRAELGVTS